MFHLTWGGTNSLKQKPKEGKTLMTNVWTSPSSCPYSRYRWLIRPPIHWFAIASLDWIGKSAPVPLLYQSCSNKLVSKITQENKFHLPSANVPSPAVPKLFKQVGFKNHTRKQISSSQRKCSIYKVINIRFNGSTGTSFTSVYWEVPHTHTPGSAGLFCFFLKQLTRKVQNYVSVLPEFAIHEGVGQEVEDHCYLGQLMVEAVWREYQTCTKVQSSRCVQIPEFAT